MKKMIRPSAGLVARFDAALPPLAERRLMFGQPAGFVNGNMCAGLFEEHAIVRLADRDRVELLAVNGATAFAPMGRPMKEYVVLPASVMKDQSALAGWIARGADYAGSLPPRERKSQKTKSTKSAAPKGATVANLAKPGNPSMLAKAAKPPISTMSSKKTGKPTMPSKPAKKPAAKKTAAKKPAAKKAAAKAPAKKAAPKKAAAKKPAKKK